MKQYKIVTEKPKAGDYVINTHDKNAEPHKVEKNINGTLGISLDGWFDWMPISDRYKKIKFITTKTPQMKKQLSFSAILKLISKAKTKKQIKKCTDLVVYFGGSPSKNTRLYDAYSKKHERLCYRLVKPKKK